MQEEQTPIHVIDACGTKCPIPVLNAKKALAKMASGELLSVKATDAGAVGDFRFFCQQTGNTFVSETQQDGVYTVVLKRR